VATEEDRLERVHNTPEEKYFITSLGCALPVTEIIGVKKSNVLMKEVADTPSKFGITTSYTRHAQVSSHSSKRRQIKKSQVVGRQKGEGEKEEEE
jgi:hypothetical protein